MARQHEMPDAGDDCHGCHTRSEGIESLGEMMALQLLLHPVYRSADLVLENAYFVGREMLLRLALERVHLGGTPQRHTRKHRGGAIAEEFGGRQEIVRDP